MNEPSAETKEDFFIVSYDVNKLYGDNETLKSKGLSATEITESTKEISDTK